MTKSWPAWPQPSDSDSLLLAKIAARYTRFLSPRIVELVVKDNDSHRREWVACLLQRGVNPDLYLWNGSPCAFPGVRRYAGSKEISDFWSAGERGSRAADALCLDDNDYPKQIWSFVFRGAPFAKFGPKGYSLAHLVDHKEYNNRMLEELVVDESYPYKVLPGLYTCPSNTTYIANGFLRPTDFSAHLRKLMIRHAASLYGDYCQMFPAGISIPECEDERWADSQFEWAPCVGTGDNVAAFLMFREQRMESLLSR